MIIVTICGKNIKVAQLVREYKPKYMQSSQPMGVATYTYNTLLSEISEYLPSEEVLKQLVDNG